MPHEDFKIRLSSEVRNKTESSLRRRARALRNKEKGKSPEKIMRDAQTKATKGMR